MEKMPGMNGDPSDEIAIGLAIRAVYRALTKPKPGVNPIPPRPGSSDPAPPKNDEFHFGVLHAHHCSLKEKNKKKWNQKNVPFSKAQGLALLSNLKAALTPGQQRDLKVAFTQAQNFIQKTATITAPPPVMRGWPHHD